jgi:hypothetical protein
MLTHFGQIQIHYQPDRNTAKVLLSGQKSSHRSPHNAWLADLWGGDVTDGRDPTNPICAPRLACG